MSSEDGTAYGLHFDVASSGVCAWCGEHIRRSPADRTWRATGYADLGGYCRQAPELAHIPRSEH